MSDDSFLTAVEIRATATEWLLRNGYTQVSVDIDSSISIDDLRVFEDPYQVVALVVFDSWENLRDMWPNAQSALISLMSKHIGKGEAKTWEGYLVLLTPGLLPRSSQEEAKEIRYNTSRVRKLVATGEQLSTTAEVHRILLPLSPLSLPGVELTQPSQVLELLPQLMSTRGIDKDAMAALVDAFNEHKPLVERLHQWRLNK